MVVEDTTGGIGRVAATGEGTVVDEVRATGLGDVVAVVGTLVGVPSTLGIWDRHV